MPSSVAKAYEIDNTLTAVTVSDVYSTVFFYSSDNKVTEVYREAIPFLYTSNSITFDYSSSYVDSAGKVSCFLLRFELKDNSYIAGQTYDLVFDVNDSDNYFYFYGFNELQPIFAYYDAFEESYKIGDNAYPSTWNINFRDKLGDDKNKAYLYTYGSYGQDSKVSLTFPVDYNQSDVAKALGWSNKIFIFVYVNGFGRVNDNKIKISNIALVPTGATVNLYSDEIYHDGVIGSDEEGQESGLKGIVSLIKNLGTKISDGFSNLLNGIIEGIKSLFVPDAAFLEDYSNRFKTLLSARLGMIWEAITILDDIGRLVLDFQPFRSNDNTGYYIRTDEFILYMSAEPPDGQSFIYSTISTDYTGTPADLSSYSEFAILPDNSRSGEKPGHYFRFDFLSKRPYKTIYDIYLLVANVIVVVTFLYYLKGKLFSILGG